MKYYSRKSPIIMGAIYLTFLLMSYFLIGDIIRLGFNMELIICAGISILVILLLLWIISGTYYEINDGILSHRSGPFHGKMEIKDIRMIETKTTRWIGYRPALALNGMVIHYNKYNELYISPKDQEAFLKELKSINEEIEIR